jgi:hypothetical protein
MRKWTGIVVALALGMAPGIAQASTAAGHGGGREHAPGLRGQQGTEHGKARDRARRGRARVAYVARGTVKAVDLQAQTITITIADRRGATNRHARGWRGTEVTFDVSDARLRVADVNADGARDLSDVAVGDRAKVLAKLPRRLESTEDAGAQVFKAKRVVVRHRAPSAPEPETPETAAPSGTS